MLALADLRSRLHWSCKRTRAGGGDKSQKERLAKDRLHAKRMTKGVDRGGENIT